VAISADQIAVIVPTTATTAMIPAR